MELRDRCKSTFTRRSGQVVRCEHWVGHTSVHYNGDVWWPNDNGPKRMLGIVMWLWVAAAITVIGAITIYWVTAR